VFFDSLGRVLNRAGEVLRTDVRAEIEDEFVRQQLDAIALIVSEVGAAWPELFAALASENAALRDALLQATGGAPAAGDDPLRENATLLVAIDTAVAALHERADGAADGALRDLRHGLVNAAEIEQELLARARERSGMATTRRL
jgi:hypothetical protein